MAVNVIMQQIKLAPGVFESGAPEIDQKAGQREAPLGILANEMNGGQPVFLPAGVDIARFELASLSDAFVGAGRHGAAMLALFLFTLESLTFLAASGVGHDDLRVERLVPGNRILSDGHGVEKERIADTMKCGGSGMSTIELRRKIKKQLDDLPLDRLQPAAEFIDFLGKKNGNRSSDSDPRIARMRLRIRQAKAAIAAGKLVPWQKLKRKH
ncbi:MAG: hypothetical protein ABSB74_11195 [Tepidisphaeraceae bacterium]